MRTRTAPVALLTALGMLFAACSGDGGTTGTTADPIPATTTTVAATTTSTTTSTTTTTTPVPPLVLWADPPVAEALAGYAADFEFETGIPLEIEEMPAAEIAPAVLDDPGDAPDLFVVSHRDLPSLLDAGLISEVEIPSPNRFQYLAVEAFTVDGISYALPYALESPALYRNTSLVAGPPQTYDDVVAACDALDTGIRCIGFPADDAAAHLAVVNAFGGYGFGYGEDGFDPGDVGLDTEGALEAAGFIDTEVAEGRFEPSIDSATARDLFASGTQAFLFSTPLADPGPDEWAAQALRPRGAQGTAVLAEAYGFAVSASSGRPEQATAFLTDFVATRHVMFDLFLAGSRPPALTRAYEDAIATESRTAAFTPNSADPAVLFPALPEAETLLAAFANALGVVYGQSYGEATPDARTAFEQAAVAIRGMLSEE